MRKKIRIFAGFANGGSVKTKAIISVFLFLALGFLPARAASPAPPRNVRISPRNAEKLVSQQSLREDVSFLADTLCGGRRIGSGGSGMASFWIAEQFGSLGLKPFGGSWFQCFPTPTGETGHNVVGMLPGNGPDARYVIIGAHFDHLGTLKGVLYPGADSNASGVAAMVHLARMLQYMARIDRPFRKNVIFIAFDGKENNMAGSHELMRRLSEGRLADPVTGIPIRKGQVDLMVNLDQVGSTLAPITPGRKDYLIMLAGEKSTCKAALAAANNRERLNLDLGFSYYGSRDFTKIFFRRICDQRPFLEAGIESVLVTSGITLNNNKPYDNAASLDYDVFRKRVILLYYWLIRSL